MSFITFHPYGFILGIALVVAVQLIESVNEKLDVFSAKFLEKKLYKWFVLALILAIIGARLWHVVTDFYLYQDNLLNILRVWNGGLSILGAVLGSVGSFAIYFSFFGSKEDKKAFFKLLDLVIFGLPVGQAVGRIANFVNAELYGLPYQGVFKLYIPEGSRLPGFESVAYYHPLFAYEMLFTSLFAAVLYYFLFKKTQKISSLIGSTNIFWIYVIYYSIVRFFLDFLRIDRGQIFFGFLGFNQVVLVFVVLLGMYFIKKNDN